MKKSTFFKGVGIVFLYFCVTFVLNNIPEFQSTSLEMQSDAYNYCVVGAPEEHQQHWFLECIYSSAADHLPATLLTMFWPVQYELSNPGVTIGFEHTDGDQTIMVHRRTLIAEVRQTIPGKQVQVYARITSMEIDGLCYFFGSNGMVTAVADKCSDPPEYHWKVGQAGFDSHLRQRQLAESIAREVGFDEEMGKPHYDSVASLVRRPK